MVRGEQGFEDGGVGEERDERGGVGEREEAVGESRTAAGEPCLQERAGGGENEVGQTGRTGQQEEDGERGIAGGREFEPRAKGQGR